MAQTDSSEERDASIMTSPSRATLAKKAGDLVIAPQDPLAVLQSAFGLGDFRDGQREVIDRLLASKNVAAVFPTGGGKSLCYQLPSQMLDGITVVVSPLIALMKDQCDALQAKGIRAARFDSTIESKLLQEWWKGLNDGDIKILYVAPERFFNERFFAALSRLKVSLFAIDEAHCISQWGHSFRPDYLKLAESARELNAERVLALTATATPEVLDDICSAFQIERDDAIRTPFFRPNLRLRSSLVQPRNQYATLLERLKTRPTGPTIVYVTLQRTAEEIAQQLVDDGLNARAYHAGFEYEVRDEVQQSFLESNDQIIVATIAFGMGIDKSDIRYVYHFNPPKSLEAYAQEIGRAGRDGEEAICEILLAPEDRIVLDNFTYGDTPTPRAVRLLMDLIVGQSDTFHVSHYKLSNESDIRMLVVRTLLTYLELDGYLKSTSPRYDTVKLQPQITSKQILANYDGERRRLVANVLSCLSKGRTWFLLDMSAAMKRLGTSRDEIMLVLDELAMRGWVQLQLSDLVHGYRWLRRPDSAKLLADDYSRRLEKREKQEIARLDGVLELVAANHCQAATLSKHFGEELHQPCGVCTACRGEGGLDVEPHGPRKVGTSAMRAASEIARSFPDHFTTPREQARFLCGLSSPHFVRARLTRDPNFGVCERVPFADVLQQLTPTANGRS